LFFETISEISISFLSLRHLTLVRLSTTVLDVFKNVLFVEDRVEFHGRCVELRQGRGGELESVAEGFEGLFEQAIEGS
jgi:hypothetical protein